VILELTRIHWHQIVATIAFGPSFCFRTVSEMFQNDPSKGLSQHRNRPGTGQDVLNQSLQNSLGRGCRRPAAFYERASP